MFATVTAPNNDSTIPEAPALVRRAQNVVANARASTTEPAGYCGAVWMSPRRQFAGALAKMRGNWNWTGRVLVLPLQLSKLLDGVQRVEFPPKLFVLLRT